MKFIKHVIFLLLTINMCFNSLCLEKKFSNPKYLFQNTISLDELAKELKHFNSLYKKKPIKTNTFGMRSVSMFWVYYIVKTINPDLIVESGIYKGQSTWLLEQAAPNAKIISIDPKLNSREYISPKVCYYTRDFSQINFGDISNLVALCFFDDHQNALSRVKQAYEKGFEHLIFDDNYPIGWGDHLSLEHCKANGKFSEIEPIISLYKIFPQIFGNTVTDYANKNTIFIDSLNFHNIKNLNIDPELAIYRKDAKAYRWTTYVSLTNKRK